MSFSGKVFLVSVIGLGFGWSAAGYAGCSSAQVSGAWETAFSDGNSCVLKLKNNGTLDLDNSICYDPDRGTASLDSGQLKVMGNCFAEGEIVVEGVSIELPVQFSQDRSIAAGRFRIAADGSKGSVVMVRVP